MNRIDTIGQNGNEGDHYEGGIIDILGKEDQRPKMGGWAPGGYSGKCSKCGDRFIGAKRAVECADCAYSAESNDEIKQDNGLTAKHYELPEHATELKHLIWYKNMNGQVAEAFRALYRLDDCAHSTRKRDLNKAKAYIDQELERMEKYDEQG